MHPKKKQMILAAKKVFIEKGFAHTSIQDILDEANVAKGTFYNYFASKNECLIAILEFVKDEAEVERRELVYGKDRSDENIFIKQIAVRMKINRKHNLLALFEAANFADDEELRTFIKKLHIEEIQWTAKRLSEIYTPQTDKYSLDHAVILMGMVHHITHVWNMGTEKKIALTKVIEYALNRLKPIIQEQLVNKAVFFPKDWFLTVGTEKTAMELKEQLVQHLEQLQNKVSNQEGSAKIIEYIQFLLEEIQANQPRKHLVETILLSLGQSVADFKYELEVRRISQLAWNCLKELDE